MPAPDISDSQSEKTGEERNVFEIREHLEKRAMDTDYHQFGKKSDTGRQGDPEPDMRYRETVDMISM